MENKYFWTITLIVYVIDSMMAPFTIQFYSDTAIIAAVF
jgi:hypothetical protein